MSDIEYMKRALDLAKKGEGRVNPNPMVGAVIVKNGEIIGEGYHKAWGYLHAERNAIASVKESIEGASIYVTLEPCCHYGKTPPCTEAIINAGIKRVFIGSADPNPLVGRKGIEILKEEGIEVNTGILEEECKELNHVFFHYIKHHRPYVVMKFAMTTDGKIATATGKSKWITGEEARKQVHGDRNKYTAIMAGVGTVLADNPMLNCRIKGGRNPVRIVCDTELRTPLEANVVITAEEQKTFIATNCTDENKIKRYLKKGCEILHIPIDKRGKGVDLDILMDVLGEKDIDSILLEGGGTLNSAALQTGIVNRVKAYIAPKIFGGMRSKTPVGGEGIDDPSDAVVLKNQLEIGRASCRERV